MDVYNLYLHINMFSKLRFSLIIISSFLLLSCGGGGGGAAAEPNVSGNTPVPTSGCATQANLAAGHFDSQYPYNSPNNSTLEALLTDFVVKESSGKGASNYPVSMVFPVKKGKYFHAGDFHIKDSSGNVIPAQFNVINRWWGDGISHCAIFKPILTSTLILMKKAWLVQVSRCFLCM